VAGASRPDEGGGAIRPIIILERRGSTNALSEFERDPWRLG
jgi:hypothetical protein